MGPTPAAYLRAAGSPPYTVRGVSGFAFSQRWLDLFLAAGERHLEYHTEGWRLALDDDPHTWVSTYDEAARRHQRETAFPPTAVPR